MNDIQTLKKWHARLRSVEKAHFNACIKYRQRHFLLGFALIASTSLSTALTGESFVNYVAGLGDSTKWFVDSVIVSVGIFATLLAATATFFGYQGRSVEHHHAAAKYAAVKRLVEIAISRRENHATDDDELGYQALEEARVAWDSMTAECPPLYKGDWSEIERYEIEIGLVRSVESKAS